MPCAWTAAAAAKIAPLKRSKTVFFMFFSFPIPFIENGTIHILKDDAGTKKFRL